MALGFQERMTGRSQIGRSVRARLAAVSGGVCQFPDCSEECYPLTSQDQPYTAGEIAHVVGWSGSGPRADASLSPQARDNYWNLLLLCRNHHREIDEDKGKYPIPVLHGWKLEHEKTYRERLGRTEFNFWELQTVTQDLAGVAATSDDVSVSLTPLREKMALNELGERSESMFHIGLLRVHHVASYIQEMSGVSSTFVDGLKHGFIAEYDRLRGEGLLGDQLFESLEDFAAQGRADLKHRSASLSVLVYLFERCEIFERNFDQK